MDVRVPYQQIASSSCDHCVLSPSGEESGRSQGTTEAGEFGVHRGEWWSVSKRKECKVISGVDIKDRWPIIGHTHSKRTTVLTLFMSDNHVQDH